jgi:PilZ domain
MVTTEQHRRRSDRIMLALPLQVTGADLNGAHFSVNAETALISRYGGTIAIARKLAPDQELTIRNTLRNREGVVRVVGQVRTQGEKIIYGVTFVYANSNLWGINFPPLDGTEVAVVRRLMECLACKSRELVYLDEVETLVLEANSALARHCKRCELLTIWREASHDFNEEPEQLPSRHDKLPDSFRIPSPPASPAPPRDKDERKRQRLPMKMTVCVRFVGFADEVTSTTDVSRGGFSFSSKKFYAIGSRVETCVPFTPGGANIFVPGEIRHSKAASDGKTFRYGVKYLDPR